jgi:hypothetical protein
MCTCPGCKGKLWGTGKNDEWPYKGRWSECAQCGYPLDTDAVLRSLYHRLEDATEFLTVSAFTPPEQVKPVDMADALAHLRDNRDLAQAAYEGDEAIIFKLVNDVMIVSFTSREHLLSVFVPSRN